MEALHYKPSGYGIAHRINLTGHSLRRSRPAKAAKE
jgi:hypothetical protein